MFTVLKQWCGVDDNGKFVMFSVGRKPLKKEEKPLISVEIRRDGQFPCITVFDNGYVSGISWEGPYADTLNFSKRELKLILKEVLKQYYSKDLWRVPNVRIFMQKFLIALWQRGV